jgi:hypothetical protein
VPSDLPADLVLTPLDGQGRTVAEWLTTFHLVHMVVDPYTNESSWILDTAARIMREFGGAGARVTWLVTADADGARSFLGPLATEFLTFVDPDRVAVKALGLERLPAFVFVIQGGQVEAVAEGWSPTAWRKVAESIATLTAWSRPTIPERADPPAYAGTAALA